MWSSLLYAPNFLLLPGYFFFTRRMRFGGAFACWTLSNRFTVFLVCLCWCKANTKVLLKDPHRAWRREVTGENVSSQGTRNIVMGKETESRSLGLSTITIHLPYTMHPNIPGLVLSAVFFNLLSSAQLSSISEQWPEWTRSSAFLGENQIPSPRWSWGVWWMYSVAHKDSKSWRFSVYSFDHMAWPCLQWSEIPFWDTTPLQN